MNLVITLPSSPQTWLAIYGVASWIICWTVLLMFRKTFRENDILQFLSGLMLFIPPVGLIYALVIGMLFLIGYVGNKFYCLFMGIKEDY